MKEKGVRSLIKWSTRCSAMLVPTDWDEFTDLEGIAYKPSCIRGYGSRAWCRAEYFIFSLWSAILGRATDVELYATTTKGHLKRFSEVSFLRGRGSVVPP